MSNIDEVIEVDSERQQACIFVIFGGTGDLTHKKLIPAIYNLKNEKMLPEHFAVVSIGRRDKSNEEYRKELLDDIKKHARFDIDHELWATLSANIYYQRFDFTEGKGYAELQKILEELDTKHNARGNRIYYLATAPKYFDIIVEHLDHNGMVSNEDAWQRIVIEKPFGRDLESAQYLNQKITQAVEEKNIYRIDHYLGKEMIQNIMFIRFANTIFESLWNKYSIDNVQITVSETIGIEGRGGYYEKSGALRDMVQNHLLQILALVAMELPHSLSTEDIRNEKVKVIKALKPLSREEVKQNVVLGQYISTKDENSDILGYREESGVFEGSDTETFAALKVYIENERWEGIPFYLRTGKRMDKKEAYIAVQFREISQSKRLYGKSVQPNLLVIRIQPFEGVFLQFNVKQPKSTEDIIPVKMDFCQNCDIDYKSPEAYERLMRDVIKGDSTLFTRWDEVEHSWKFIDKITKCCINQKEELLKLYEVGSKGPKEAEKLLGNELGAWW